MLDGSRGQKKKKCFDIFDLLCEMKEEESNFCTLQQQQ